MKIDDIYELCEAVCDFHSMMTNDRNLMHDRAERMGDGKAVAKMMLLNNLLEEFEDIAKFAQEYVQSNGETL